MSQGIEIRVTARSEPNLSVFRNMYYAMLRIRRFEERVGELIEAGEIKTPCHLCIGQEAIPVGICAMLDRRDYVWGNHRSHGHYLAKGGDLKAMMAEIYGKVTGCSRGRGGSMHLVDPDVGILGTVPLVAGTIPLAVGAGLASKLRGDRRVSVSFFGDGATDEGHFYESLNLAALYRLPVVFVCENNFYSTHMHISERRANGNICNVGDLYGVPSKRIDGNDVFEVYQAAKEAVERARSGYGPTFLECLTYRWRGHVGSALDLDVGITRRQELKEWLRRDPIARAKARLIELGLSENELVQIEESIVAEIEEAVAFARESPYPDESEVSTNVFSDEGAKR